MKVIKNLKRFRNQIFGIDPEIKHYMLGVSFLIKNLAPEFSGLSKAIRILHATDDYVVFRTKYFVREEDGLFCHGISIIKAFKDEDVENVYEILNFQVYDTPQEFKMGGLE